VAGSAKPYRKSYWRRALNAVVRPLARLGLTGPRTHLLTVRGRSSDRLWSTPVSIVEADGERWLVAPYGDRNWVLNARAAGRVGLRRGQRRELLSIEELAPADAVPVLRRYYELGTFTRPFFDVSLDSSDEDWLAEAPRHPVFRLVSTILLVAATEPELCGHPGLACGIGPVEAAATTAHALARERPAGVLHVGLAGGVGLEPGSLVVGTESVYADLSAAIPVTSRVESDDALLAAIRAAVPDAPALPIATAAAVGGVGQGFRVEAMEGFGVLRACELAGVPAVEVRAISNELGEPDRARWELEKGLAALAEALPRLLAAARQ
jgi:futalosine hydrolase